MAATARRTPGLRDLPQSESDGHSLPHIRPRAPVDFKYMVHAVHSSSIRKTPYVVIGRNGSVNDYSEVKFPRNLRNCLNCHVDGHSSCRWAPGVLGTTIATGSSYGTPKVIDTNPATI